MLKRIRDRILIVIIVMSALITIPSCYVTKEIEDVKNLSYIYNPTKNFFTPYFSVFSQNDTTSIISTRLAEKDLYFNEANPSGLSIASLYISVKLYDNTIGGVLADTAALRYDITPEKAKGEFVSKLTLTTYPGKSYSAEIKIIDNIRQHTYQSFIDFEKSGLNDRINFMIRDNFSHNELYNNTIRNGQFINILYPSASTDSIWVLFYQPVKTVPPAPTELLPEVTPDDEPLKIVPLAYSDTLPLMFPHEGIYLITLDSMARQGFTLFNFGEDHPTMTNAATMIPPLAFLATPEEMESMMNAEKQKVALDDFWLKRTGSIERSKELIRIYYNRVLYANYYFTSYKEGWLTDRGMIYIIYGPPDKVYKNADGESWGYKEAKQKSPWGPRYSVKDTYLWFNFNKKKNIFTEKDYTLNRASTPISYWDIAVASWRRGKVFSLDDPEELQ